VLTKRSSLQHACKGVLKTVCVLFCFFVLFSKQREARHNGSRWSRPMIQSDPRRLQLAVYIKTIDVKWRTLCERLGKGTRIDVQFGYHIRSHIYQNQFVTATRPWKEGRTSWSRSPLKKTTRRPGRGLRSMTGSDGKWLSHNRSCFYCFFPPQRFDPPETKSSLNSVCTKRGVR